MAGQMVGVVGQTDTVKLPKQRIGKLIFGGFPPVGYLPPHDSPSNINGFLAFQAFKALPCPTQNLRRTPPQEAD